MIMSIWIRACTLLFVIELTGQSSEMLSILDRDDLKHTHFGYSIVDLQTGESIAGYNDSEAFTPASTLKLITTLATMDIMGGDYHYRTPIYIRGEIDASGTLHGDLIIAGMGDPSLGSQEQGDFDLDALMSQIYSKLSSTGVKCIDGDLIIDASRFTPYGICDQWSWDDLCNYYAAGAYAININENEYTLYFDRSTQSGEPAAVDRVEPSGIGLQHESKVLTGATGSGDNAYLYGDPYGYSRVIRGTIPPGQGDFDIRGAIPDPPIFFLRYLKIYLLQLGIKSERIRVCHDPLDTSQAVSLWTIESPSLRELVKRANTVSHNLYCEAFYKTMAAQEKGLGSFKNAEATVNEWLEKVGVASHEVKQRDGSGLAIANTVTPSSLTKVLYSYAQKYQVDDLKLLLPKVGKEGSVKYLLRSKPSVQNAYLKSGSISGVLSYAGIIKTQSGKWIAISIIANGHQCGNRKMRGHMEDMIVDIYKLY